MPLHLGGGGGGAQSSMAHQQLVLMERVVMEMPGLATSIQMQEAFNGCVRLHQIPAIPESVSQSAPFDYIIPELELPEFNSADSSLEAEF